MTTLIRRETRDVSPRQFIDAFFGGSPFEGRVAPRAFAPDFEVRETKDGYVFRADVPGIAQKDVEIQLTGNVLSIAGERKAEGVSEGERTFRTFAAERAYGRFARSFVLPEGADGERVTADLKDGVLTVNVPKKPQVQPRRINVGAPTKPDAAG